MSGGVADQATCAVDLRTAFYTVMCDFNMITFDKGGGVNNAWLVGEIFQWDYSPLWGG